MNFVGAERRKLSGYWMTGDSRRLNGITSEQLHVRLRRVDSPETDMKAGKLYSYASLAALRPLF